MRYLFSAIVLSAAICTTDAQQINISGKVIDTTLKGLPDASVSMVTYRLSTLSGLDGSFSLTGNARVSSRASSFHAPGPVMTGNSISLTLDKEQRVTIAAFDPHGRCIRKTASNFIAGSHVVPVFPRNSPAQMVIIKFQTGGKTFLLKACTNYIRGRTLSPLSTSNADAIASAAKAVATLDSLSVALAGYVPVVLPLDSLTGN